MTSTLVQACHECTAPGVSCGVSHTADPAPCVCCGKPTGVVSLCGVPRTYVCPGRTRAPGEPANSPDPAPVSQFEEHTGLIPWLRTKFPAASDVQVRYAERLWKDSMRGIGWNGPGATAKNILNGTLKHHSIPELPEFTSGYVWKGRDWQLGGTPWTDRTWMTEDRPAASVGSRLSSWDINGMYLGAAASEMGLGDPLRLEHLPEAATAKGSPVWWSVPGYVQPLEFGDDYTYDLALRMTKPGQWIPTPLAAYMDQTRKVTRWGPAVLWPQHRRVLDPHVDLMRAARKRLMSLTTERCPSECVCGPHLALRAVKSVYTRMFGGMLRSERYNDSETLRPDWGDMISSTGQARMFRALDRASAPVSAIHADAAWFVTPADTVPTGLTVDTQILGKFKPPKMIDLDAAAVRDYTAGSWMALAKRLSANG